MRFFTFLAVLILSSCTSDNTTSPLEEHVGELGYPCSSDGTCDEGLLCTPQNLCARPTSPCDEHPCGENESCVENNGEATCQCQSGTFQSLTGSCHVGETVQDQEYHSQPFQFELETRYYYLYVPPDYTPQEPWPVLVDLHGTATSVPEEAYGLEAARQLASERGYLLLRPRSRSSQESTYTVFRWDQNPGDTDLNHRFITALLEELSTQYHMDPEALYLMGFSSGTNQTGRALSDPETPFKGFGFIGGGVWLSGTMHNSGRIYLATGYKDYMHPYTYTLKNRLTTAGLPTEMILERELEAGHELYDWFYPELWDFLHLGIRPPEGALTPSFSLEETHSTDTLLGLAQSPRGTLIAAGTGPSLHERLTDGTWHTLSLSGSPAFSGRALTELCFTKDGTGLALGEGLRARSVNGGESWTHLGAVGEVDSTMFGYQHLNGVTCAEQVVAGGYWQGVSSDDGGLSFNDVEFVTSYGQRAQIAFLRHDPEGKVVAGGYYAYLGYVDEFGVSWSSEVDNLSPASWFYDAVALGDGEWIAAGDHGTLLRSRDGGATYSCLRCHGGSDLYALAAKGERVVAVGIKGTLLYSLDSGDSWFEAPTGLDQMLTAVHFLNDTKVLIVGEAGLALTMELPSE